MKCNHEKPLSYIDELLERELNERTVAEMLPKTAASAGNTETVKAYLRKNYPADTLHWVKDAEWEQKDVPLSSIQMDRRPGGARETDKVKNIAQAVKDGQKMEPVVLVETPSGLKMKVADGYHRTLGFKHANKASIRAWVGKVESEKGPWDKEMHEKKLNVGKTASLAMASLEKEAALPAVKALGGLALKAGKGFAKQTLNAGKSLTGANVYKASKAKKNTLANPQATTDDVKKANRALRKSQAGMAGSWAGLGAASVAGNYAQKTTEERKGLLNGQQPKKPENPQNKYHTY